MSPCVIGSPVRESVAPTDGAMGVGIPARHSAAMSARTRLNLYATLVAVLAFTLLAFSRA
jgi:hypothetical protein